MTAVGFYEHGDIENLQLLEVDVPVPGPDDVLVDVRATSVNHQDLFAVRELDHYISEYPFWGGGDAAGVVVSVGKDVTDWEPGERVVVNNRVACRECDLCLRGEQSMCRNLSVLGEHRPGGFAEYLRIPSRNLFQIPDHVGFAEAAALPATAGTAWRGLLNRGNLSPADDLLIVGATGGLGSFSVQVAADIVGVDTLYATTSTEKKAEFLCDLGVDHVINYTEESFDERIWDLTDGKGVDVVYNSVGGDTWTRSMRCLRNGGRLVTSGATAGPNPQTEIRLVFMRQLEVIGSTSHTALEFGDVLKKVWDGEVEPIIQETYPLAGYETAFRKMDNRELYGKVVLTQ